MIFAPPPDTTLLLLVRHGATSANEQKPYILQGDSMDLPLSPNGQEQARAVGNFLAPFPVKHVYCSTMLRARQTAGEIARHHHLEIQPIDGITECAVGKWEGMDWTSIEAQYPEECRRFLENPAEIPYLGGESYGDVQRRVMPILERLLDQHRGKLITVVAHNVVNRVIISQLLGFELKRAKELHQQNCCVNLIQKDSQETTLLTMNSIFHLHKMPVI